MTLQLSEELAQVLQTLDQPVERTAGELIVLELYRQRRISAGKAGELLGMSQIDFIRHASDLGIPYIDMTHDEFRQELAEVDRIAREHHR